MSLLSILQSGSSWAPVVLVRDSKYGMPAVQSVHLIGLTTFLATLVTVNLRLAGFGRVDWSPSWLARQLRPWMAAAIATVLLSGSFIFLATPGKYVASNPFRVKMTALALAILFHFLVFRRFVAAEPGARRRSMNILVAGVSLTLWFSVGWAGRAIAFVP
jgi:hypothetical protein